jgi:hypothetical protein
MSNFISTTIPNISYSNTFGQWVTATNNLVSDHNQFASNNYQKNAGTLYLNDPTLGLQVNSAAVFQNTVTISGIGSSATIQNNLTVSQGQVYFSNTQLGLYNAGQMIVGGVISANGSGTGLNVANNAIIGGTAGIGGNASVGGNLSITGNETVGGTLGVTGNETVGGTLTVVGATTLENNVLMQQNTSVSHYLTVGNDITAVNESLTGSLSVGNQLTVTGPTTVSSLQTTGQLSVGGAFILNGATVYNSNTFTLNANSSVGQISSFSINRGSSGANAAIRWNEPSKYWDILDVVNGSNYSQILTANLISDSLTSTASAPYVASQLAANTLNNYLTSNVSSLQSQISSNVSSLQSQISSNVSTLYAAVTASYNRANTSSNTFTGTTGTAIPNAGGIAFASNNGVVISGTSNNLYVNTPQDVRTTASPTFASLNLTAPLAINEGGTGATSAGSALTALLPTGTTAGYVLTTSGPGSFYWAAGGGGSGGATPGTTISSTSLQYTANGSGVAYTTPVYVPGADQLKIYFDGVRQHPGTYTETSGNTGGVGIVTFSSAVPSGVSILTEVDGYSINPYYANNIAYTVNSNISSSANTIQLAIDGLTSKVVTYYANTAAATSFSNPLTAPTPSVGTSNTQVATTSYVNALANSGITFSHNINGSAATITGTYGGSISSSQVTTALGYTPVNSTNVNQAVNTNSNVEHASLYVGGTYGATYSSGQITAEGNIIGYYSSDKKFKENIRPIPNALETAVKIGGKLYDWTDEYIKEHGGANDYFMQKNDFGVIAQDVREFFPVATRTRPDGSLAVDYEKLCALAFEAIKELKEEVNALKGITK